MTDNERRIIAKLNQIIKEADSMALTHSPGEQLGFYSGSLKILINSIEVGNLKYEGVCKCNQ